MVNYGKFILNLSTIAAPLNQLRRKDVPCKWTQKEEEVYQRLKKQLSSAKALIHYNPKLPLKLDCNASSVRIGEVLSHIMETGEEKQIAYATRSLTKVEQNYSQIEREVLRIETFVSAVVASIHTSQTKMDTYCLVQEEDPVCSKVIEHCRSGWPEKHPVPAAVRVYWKARNSLFTIIYCFLTAVLLFHFLYVRMFLTEYMKGIKEPLDVG